jgi:nitric oxide reductase NorQ protein
VERNTVSENPNGDDVLSESEIAKLSPQDQVRYAVENGCHDPADIHTVTQITEGWTDDVLAEMHNAGDLVKTTTDDAEARFHLPGSDSLAAARTEPKTPASEGTDDTVTTMEADEKDVSEAAAENGGQIPVDRDYDWAAHKLDPSSVVDYVDSNGEYGDIRTEIEMRGEIGKLPRFRMTGPTGCGKTTLGEAMAVEMDAPCFTVECHDGLRPNNLLGMPTYVGDETWFVDGPVTKALLASQAANDPTTDFDEVFLIFDEVNRTTARTLGVVMSALDHRGEVTLNARGGETVSGDPMNLVVISTMNEGDGYITNPIDRAQKRRFGNTYPVDYIGMNDTTKEVDLIADQTPVRVSVARKMVNAANEIREKAQTDDSPIEMGVPTSEMLDWARSAWAYRERPCDGGPVMKAARRTLLNTFYDDGRAADVVTTTFESYVRGLELNESDDDESESDDDEAKSLGELFGGGDSDETDDSDDALGGASEDDDAYDTDISVSDETWLMCGACGFSEKATDAEDEVVTTMMCPACDESLRPMDAE